MRLINGQDYKYCSLPDMRLINGRDSNVCNVLSQGRTLLFTGDHSMPDAQFYFLSDQYYIDFPDEKLMKNKDTIDGVSHSRPCFFAFPDAAKPEIFWIIPVSSRCEKYKQIEHDKIQKYGRCNTIRFGLLLNRNTAFLIQNMCPTIECYLTPYTDKNNQPIRIDDRTAADVRRHAQEVLALAKRGAKVIFPDVFTIYRSLEKQLTEKEELTTAAASERPGVRREGPA